MFKELIKKILIVRRDEIYCKWCEVEFVFYENSYEIVKVCFELIDVGIEEVLVLNSCLVDFCVDNK